MGRTCSAGCTTKNAPDETLLWILNLKQTQTVYVVDQSHPLYGHTTKVERKIMALGLPAKIITNTHDLRMIT